MITARLGDEHRSGTQRLYNIIMPVAIKGQNIGYIHINWHSTTIVSCRTATRSRGSSA